MFFGFLSCIGILYLLGKYFKYIRNGYERKIEEIAKFYNNRKFIMTKKYIYIIDDRGIFNTLVNDFEQFMTDFSQDSIDSRSNKIEVYAVEDSSIKLFSLNQIDFYQKIRIYQSLIRQELVCDFSEYTKGNEEKKDVVSNQINDLLNDLDF